MAHHRGRLLARVKSGSLILTLGIQGLAFALLICRPAIGAEPTYDKWVATHAPKDLHGHFQGGKTCALRLTAYIAVAAQGTEISTDGQTFRFYSSPAGAAGGADQPLSPDALKKLKGLLAQLPDDKKHLPPRDRALLLQANTGGKIVTRVYDRANAPAIIWEIIQLTQSGVNPWVEELHPRSEIAISPTGAPGGTLCLSPNREQMLVGLGPIQMWSAPTPKLLATLPPAAGDPPYAFSAFSPRGNLAVLSGDSGAVCVDTGTLAVVKNLPLHHNPLISESLRFPHFTPDGRYLLVTDSEPSLIIYDTTTWHTVPSLPLIPANALKYFPSPKKERAVVETKAGSLLLWNPATHEQVATLAENARCPVLAFSPDGNRVALVAEPANAGGKSERLCIYAIDSGKQLLDSEQGRWGGHFGTRYLAWSPDGEYLLSDGYCLIKIINARTGRPRGELVGARGDVAGLGLLPRTGQVVAAFEDGKIRFWDLNAALLQIRLLEATLPNESAGFPILNLLGQ